MRILLACNPESGGGVDVAALSARLRELGADVVEDGAERIVAVGGDGSLAPAAARAARDGVPLAVVPAGTANDFARATGLPMDRDAAVELAVRGTATRSLELAEMDGRPFLNTASTGLSPAAARRAEPFKRGLGPLAYPLGAALAGLLERPARCRATVDGREVFSGACWQLTVACTGAFGGGAAIDAADPADGLLDLVVVPAGSRLALPRHALAMRRGTIADQPGVVHVRGDGIEVELPPQTAFNVDGEVVQARPRAHFTARQDAFSLVVS